MKEIMTTWFASQIILSEIAAAFVITLGGCFSIFASIHPDKKFTLKYSTIYPVFAFLTPLTCFLIAHAWNHYSSLPIIFSNPINLFLAFFREMYDDPQIAYFKGLISVLLLHIVGFVVGGLIYYFIFKNKKYDHSLKAVNKNASLKRFAFKESIFLYALVTAICVNQFIFRNDHFWKYIATFFANTFMLWIFLLFSSKDGNFASNLNLFLGVNFIYLIRGKQSLKGVAMILISTTLTITFCAILAYIIKIT
ncbi:hypothetical protein V2E24_02495 [Mycoplasmopsis ciconiae]|uniref:Uncharacterized protein n=1 Tax=Mycoplasmopsis ciconiae TaxID=561067 RepID=A0ABU7MLN0_9BACT|nr:hypothetical protein [Mycoplasmopsis ciconiae]